MPGRISLLVGFFAMVLSTLIGTVTSALSRAIMAGVGAVLMRFVDAFLSFPSIFLLLALAAFVKPSPFMITVIIAVTSWMEIARLVEAEVRSLRERDFVLAARHARPAERLDHVPRASVPNAVGPIIVAATLTVARAILLEAYISFLGYGIQPPLPSWGNMLNAPSNISTRRRGSPSCPASRSRSRSPASTSSAMAFAMRSMRAAT